MNYYGQHQFKPGMLIRIVEYKDVYNDIWSPSYFNDKIVLVIAAGARLGVCSEDEIKVLIGDEIHVLYQSKCTSYEV